MLPARRALGLALALLLLAPLAAAQDPVPDPQPPSQLDCQLEDCLPDLLPSNPRAETSDERFPATVCADFVNIGRGPTAVPFRMLLRIDGADVAERQFQKVYEQGAGESNVCWENIAVGRGRHTMEVVIDYRDEVLEADEGNNARAVVFSVRAKPEVDLLVASLEVTPRDGGPGQTQLFIVNVTNRGQLPSNATMVELSDDHGALAAWPLPALQPAQTRTFIHATRPDLRPVGTFVARAVVDPANNVTELFEDNNDAFAAYTVLEHPAPDYVISNVTVTGNLTELRGIRIDAIVENIGDRAVRGTTVRIVNETNATLAQGVTRSIILPGTSGTVQFIATLRAGDYRLKLIADPTSIVPERDERNNERELNLTILPAPVSFDAPNLVVERIFAMPEDPRPGERVSVGALVHNVGTVRSNATNITFTIEGRVVGTAPVPALAPDAFHTAYVPWAGGPADTYDIRAEVDPADRIFELAEDDNHLAREFLITSQRLPEEEPAPEPTTPTPPTPAPATPVPTTPPTPTPTTPAAPTPVGERLVFGEIILSTAAVPGGLKGVISASLRNPSVQPVGALTVQFKVDGELLVERLITGVRGAATIAVTSGEVDLPEGKHKITAELRLVGSNEGPVVREREYDEEGAPKGIPGFEALLLLAAVALALAVRRR